MTKLTDRIALITGSDSGIGQAMAEEFARAGADVAVPFHTDEEGAEETCRRVEAAGRRAPALQVDVRDEWSVFTHSGQRCRRRGHRVQQIQLI
jgi:glucose 1-dehydrogenase